ncbi:MAG TPA: pyridoxal-phosphate dependent enzyme, partial [Thermomicrobiales bacterium]|nr:pyridoxal-phosphate dependent enzyme [Thermomicrobiales bacterium]
THAGLVAGAHAYSASFTPIGIAVEGGKDEMCRHGLELTRETAKLIGLNTTFQPEDIHIDDGFFGEGYGIPTAEGLDAIRLLARTEAVVLDPVYSGKALAGLIAHVRAGEIGPDESVVFLHTGGGPSIFPFGEILLAG